jgi:glycosyltransferase involved in cell wall biosynthesis
MAEVLERTITDKTLLADLSKRGLAQTKKYSWKKMAEETLALYGDACK